MSARVIAYDNESRTRHDKVCRNIDAARAEAARWKSTRNHPDAVVCKIISRSNVIWKMRRWRTNDVWVRDRE